MSHLKQVQLIERRSIAIHDTPQMLPISNNRSVFKQTPEEKKALKALRCKFVSINK